MCYIGTKHIILFNFLITMIEITQGIGCTRDVFPIVHGNYLAEIPLPNLPSNLKYKHTRNPVPLDVNTYSNGDILVSYYFQITEGNQNTNLTLGQTSGIAKIDFLSGKTLWAKEIYANYSNNMFMVINSYIVDEYAYTMLVANNSANNYPAVILKLDTNGETQDSFAVMKSLKSTTYNYKLYVYRFYVYSDSSLLLFAQSTYLQGEIGVSNSSQIDLSIFKMNSTKDIEWNTSVDFMNGVEEYAFGYIHENKLYASVYTSKFYL